MGNSRRRFLGALILGIGALKVGSEYVGQQSETGANNTSSPTDEPDILYHERQNAYLQSGQLFAETFQSTGQNTLRLRTPDFPTINGHLGLYTYDEWKNLQQGVEDNSNWEAGTPIRTLPVDPNKSVYEFQLNRDTKYAIVFGLRGWGTGTPEPRNIGFEYWVYD